MKLIFFLILSCLTFAQEVRQEKDGDTTNFYNKGLTTPAEIVAGRKNVDSVFLSSARFKDNVNFDSAATFRNGVFNLIEYTTFEEYGAIGDGVTNDSAAVVNALTSGKPVKGVSGRTYLVNNASVITLTGYDINLSSTGNEPFKISFAQNVAGFEFFGSVKTSGLLLKDSLEVGSKKLVFTSVTQVDTGDLIFLYNVSDYWSILDTALHVSKYDLHLVEHINGDTVFTEVGSWDTYDGISNSNPTTVYIYDPITVRMKNVIFEYPNSSISDNITGIKIVASKNDVIEDIEIDKARYTGMILWYSYNSQIIRPHVNYSNYVGTGYGIYLSGTFNCLIEGGYFNENRSATDGGTLVSRNNIYRNNTSTLTKTIVGSRGFGIHVQSQNCVWENNTIYNSYYGIVVGGEGHTIRGNRFFNNTASTILLAQAKNATVDGNIADIFYEFPNYSASLMPAYFVQLRTDYVSDENSSINIINNISNVSYNTFIYVETNLYHLNVTNNIMKHFTSSSYLVNAASVDTVWYANIRNNTYNGMPDFGTGLSNNIVFVDSYTEFYNPLSRVTSVSGDISLEGNITTNGISIDSLANVISYFNVIEDTTVTSIITNGGCEGVYTSGLAAGLEKAGVITTTQESGINGGNGQGFNSSVYIGQGNVRFFLTDDLIAGQQYSFSFYVKKLSGDVTTKMNYYFVNNFYGSGITPTGTFQKFEFVVTPTTTVPTSYGAIIKFGNYGTPDSTVTFVIDSVILRPLQHNITQTNINLDSTIYLTEIDSLPYLPTNRVKVGNAGGELKAKDTGGNEFILTDFPPVTIPSDSTGLPTGSFYFRSSDGIIRRKY